MSGGIKEYHGVFRVYFVSETAQVELRSGRVLAPAQLVDGQRLGLPQLAVRPECRGLHSSTFRLNLGALRGIGGVYKGS